MLNFRDKNLKTKTQYNVTKEYVNYKIEHSINGEFDDKLTITNNNRNYGRNSVEMSINPSEDSIELLKKVANFFYNEQMKSDLGNSKYDYEKDSEQLLNSKKRAETIEFKLYEYLEQIKKENNVMNENNNANEMINKTGEKLKSLVENYIADEKAGVAITPTGLSINGKVYSKEDGQLLDVSGTEIIKDMPLGFCIPTDFIDIKVGDIIYDNENRPLHVVKKSGKAVKSRRVQCIEPNTNTEINVLPTVDILGKQTFNKLITPFNYNFGCNPALNVLSVAGMNYLNGDIEKGIDELLPYIVKYISAVNFSKFADKNIVKFVGLALAIAYSMNSKDILDVNNLKDKLEEFVEKFKSDKKIMIAIFLGLALIVYLSKDIIVQKITEDKIKNIPLIGNFAEPLSKILLKLPKINMKNLNIKEKISEILKHEKDVLNNATEE